MIEFIKLSIKINNNYILNNISFNIKKGEIFGILGPNGAGKTTILNVIIGLFQNYSGKCLINNKSIEDNKKIIGYLPEIPYIFPYLTGEEYLWFIGSLYQIPEQKIDMQIKFWTNFFKITPYLSKLGKTFPKGIRQKFGICSALINDPEIILLDEPTSSLDPASAKLVKLLTKELKTQGKTIILTTHILEVAEILCDRIVIIKNGELKACGSMDDLKKISKSNLSSLEDIFLELTGEFEYRELIDSLKKC